jgi:hypothetical protein
MAELQLLLMRHGAGIKPGQDPEKVQPGPDRVLTAQGYRDAQAVGHVLAETLNWSSRPVPGVRCFYAGLLDASRSPCMARSVNLPHCAAPCCTPSTHGPLGGVERPTCCPRRRRRQAHPAGTAT